MLYNNVDLLTCKQTPLGDSSKMFPALNYAKYTLEQLHKDMMRLLREINRICNQESIPFFLMYGTLIGAMRHSGMVPWDDDCDISMSFENYQRFKEACQHTLSDEFVLCDYNSSEQYPFVFGRLRIKKSSYMLNCEISNHENTGIYVDIILFSPLSDRPMRRGLQMRALQWLYRRVSVGFNLGHQGISPLEEGVLWGLEKLLGRKRLFSWLEHLATGPVEESHTNVMMHLLLRSRNLVRVLDKAYFQGCQRVPFEGEQFPIPLRAAALLDDLYAGPSKNFHFEIPEHLGELPDAQTPQNIYCAEYQFLPTVRSRERHLEVVLDPNTPSESFIQQFKDRVDWKKNKQAARKDRWYGERGIQYKGIMDENSRVCFLAIKELRTRTFFEQEAGRIADSIAAQEYGWIIEELLFLDVLCQERIPKERLDFFMELALKAGMKGLCLRLVSKRRHLFPKNKGDALECRVLDMARAYYALVKGDEEPMGALCQAAGTEWEQYLDFTLWQMLRAYQNRQEQEALELCQRLLQKNHLLFEPHYYSGLLLLRKGEKQQAREAFLRALGSTNFWPELQQVIEQIQILDREECLV